MANYLLQVSYTPGTWAALIKNPQDRGEAVRGPIANLGGELEHIWLAFGEDDIIAIVDMPDNVAAAAIAIAISAGGGVKSVKTTPLMSVQDGITALQKAAQCGYKPAQSGPSS